MTHTHFIITAAGRMSRWCNYMHIPKHLVPINEAGDCLLHHTVRQIKTWLPKATITILGRDDRYAISGTRLVIKSWHKDCHVPPACQTANDYFEKHQSNVVLFGDTYFTQAAWQKIVKRLEQPQEKVVMIGRHGPNPYTGCRYSDLFGFIVPASERQSFSKLIAFMLTVKHRLNKKQFNTWHVYRHMNQLPVLKDKICRDTFLHICDMTEDFDYPEDYENWRSAMLKNKHK